MARTGRIPLPTPAPDVSVLIHRARRFRRRGELRRALLILREAAFRESSDARLWTLYGVECVRMGKRDDAVEALKQAVWLRVRDHDEPRARVTRGLIACVLAGDDSFRVEHAA